MSLAWSAGRRLSVNDSWQQIWQLFHGALEKEASDRPEFLRQECGDDSELEQAVLDLLARHDESFGLLDQPLSSLADGAGDLVGQSVGAFKIEAELGEGGMGVVYRALQEEPLRRTVALKLIQFGLNTREVMARFELERRALAVLDHPNIARVFDAGATEEGRPYFVMELVDGFSVTDYCNRNRLSIKERLELFIPVCRAVHHAHQKGIIHRDLKPSNVLVALHDGKPVPKIIDFGVARAVDSRRRGTVFTRHGRLVGTPEYMSPEQADLSLDVDVRTDIYSLGVLLYELLVGCLPFDGGLRAVPGHRLVDVLREREAPKPSSRISALGHGAKDVAARRRSDPSTLRRQLKGEVDWVVMRALEKDRSRRYGAASELAQELERLLRNEPVLAGPPGPAYQLRKLVRRHRVAVAGAMLGLTLSGAFTVSTVRQSADLRQALYRAEQEAEKAEQVTGLLVNLFKVSDPGEARGNSILAREVLDRGAEQIHEQLGDQEEIRAELMDVIGRVYGRLGLLSEAEPLLETGLDIRRRTYGTRHRETADSLFHLAELRIWQGRFAEAAALFRRSLEIHREHDEQSTQVATALHGLGEALLKGGKLKDAEPVLEQALDMRHRLSGAWHGETGHVTFALGVCRVELGQFAEGEDLLRRSLAIGEKTLRQDDPELARRMERLALVLLRLGRAAEAEPLSRRAVDLSRRTYGDGHTHTAAALSNLATRLDRMGKIDEVEALYLESLGIWRAQASENPGLVPVLSNLGAFYRRRGRIDEAVVHLREAVAVGRRALPDSPQLADAMNNLGVALLYQNAEAQSEALHKEALELQRRILGEEHLAVAASLGNLGVLSRRAGRLDEAIDYYHRAVAIEEYNLGEDHPRVARNLYNLAIASRDLGRLADAESVLRRTLEIERRAKGDEHADTALQMAALGKVLSMAGKLEEAEELLRRALAIQRRTLKQGSWWLLLTEHYLGACLVQRREFSEAEAVLLSALEGFTELRGPQAPQTVATLESLVTLYTSWQRPAESRRYQRRLQEVQAG